ncbi:MAG: phosphomannomutase/phosphoglucomutase [Bdellovibrionales bacterium]|nr:phosphomannomutase/phosphoglucomutase [Bdellovibrionales bacterium]
MRSVNPSIFREYDIRGVAHKDIDASFAFYLGRAFLRLARERLGTQSPVISVGHDCRLTGKEFSRALLTGLRTGGAHVLDLGLVTTPMTYFSLFQKKLGGAIMVTGSHNPPEYNGFKICIGKSTLHGQDIQTLKKYMTEEMMQTSSTAVPENDFQKLDIIPEYHSFIKDNVRLQRPLKIVVDAGNGSAGPFAPAIYESLGCKVIPLYCEPDGRFPNHEADPTVVKNMQPLIASVRKEGADLGIAFDGDADRIGVVDETGRILWGDELMVLFSRDVLRKNPGATIISEVKSSHRLYNDIRKNGGNAVMWKTGHSLIKAKMKESGALLAGEMSGHIFFADRFFGFDDAIYAGARFLEIVASSPQKTSSLLADLPAAVNTPEIRLDCDDAKKWGVIENLKNQLRGRYEVNEIDGVRVEFGDAWGLVRASNTQPVIVMRFEAQSAERLEEVRGILEDEAKKAGLVL